MTTKKTAEPAAPEAETTVQPRPNTVTIHESGHLAFPAACHLIRTGYTISPDALPFMCGVTGQVRIVLVRGNPPERAVEIATAGELHAAGVQQMQYEKDVAIAAAQMLEDARRAEAKAVLEADVADSEKALRALKDKLARAA